MLWNKSKNFCDISPTTYAISQQKEIIKRHLQDFLGKDRYAASHTQEKLPVIVASHDSRLLKRGPGIDPVLQENKAVNIRLACKELNGLIIHPGETFSFWKTVGKTSRSRGYMDGRVIVAGQLQPGIGGGLCNLSNTIHLLILESPLTVTEFHHHSDALAPDEGPRVPFSTGTSVSYNNIDYRVRNDTDQDFQLLLWCDEDRLYGELRSEKEIPWAYRLVEEGHHFHQEGEKYYRISKIYRETIEKDTQKVIEKKLLLDNHSEVMYDPALIPKELIR
ncbi:MAG: VanW family protein [Blautia sp.]|nr:VanW family protein [Blautia sp.]